ncbi:MAG: hypothetical protein V9G19_22120 [Tetrasphaera sp.]
MVDIAQPAIGGPRRQLGHGAQQGVQLLVALGGEQEVVERLEAAALVGGGDRLPVADQLTEQVALGPSQAVILARASRSRRRKLSSTSRKSDSSSRAVLEKC